MRNTLKIANRLLLAVIVAGAAACSDGSDSSTGPSTPPPGGGTTSASGSYALAQVRSEGNLQGGGDGLPVTFTDGGGTALTFISGTLLLGADGSFDLAVSTTFKGDSVTLTDFGTYSLAGGSISFASQKSTPRLSAGTMNGNTLTAKSQFAGIPFAIDLVK